MKKIALIIIIFSLNIGFAYAMSTENILKSRRNLSENLHNQNADTCVISGLRFKVIDNRSSREWRAVVQDDKIKLVGKTGEYHDFRITGYVFSSWDNDNIPIVRTSGKIIDFRVLLTLRDSKPGDRYVFEDIAFVDASGKKLSNKVRALLIERI